MLGYNISASTFWMIFECHLAYLPMRKTQICPPEIPLEVSLHSEIKWTTVETPVCRNILRWRKFARHSKYACACTPLPIFEFSCECIWSAAILHTCLTICQQVLSCNMSAPTWPTLNISLNYVFRPHVALAGAFGSGFYFNQRQSENSKTQILNLQIETRFNATVLYFIFMDLKLWVLSLCKIERLTCLCFDNLTLAAKYGVHKLWFPACLARMRSNFLARRKCDWVLATLCLLLTDHSSKPPI